MSDVRDVEQTIESINIIAKDVDAKESGIKVMKDQLNQIIGSMPEYQAVVEAKEEYDSAKESLRIALMGKPAYNNLMEKLGNEKQDLKDDREVLSSHVVEYYALTHEHQIELDGDDNARAVVVKGKLGKSGKYQPSLFSAASVEISDGQTTIETTLGELGRVGKKLKSKVVSEVH